MPEMDTPAELAAMMAEAAKIDALFRRCAPWIFQRMLALQCPRPVETREAAE